jgi:hypothetical protein
VLAPTALYLASADAAVRAAFAGARNLDDLTFTMLERLQGGQSYDGNAWSQLVERELGAQGPRSTGPCWQASCSSRRATFEGRGCRPAQGR